MFFLSGLNNNARTTTTTSGGGGVVVVEESAAVAEFQFCLPLLFVRLRVVLLLLLNEIIVKIDESWS